MHKSFHFMLLCAIMLLSTAAAQAQITLTIGSPTDKKAVKDSAVERVAYLEQKIANLKALMQWYNNIRSLFISKDFLNELLEGLKEKLGLAITERTRRFEEYYLRQKGIEIPKKWERYKNKLDEHRQFTGDNKLLDKFLEKLSAKNNQFGNNYIKVIKSLDVESSNIGTMWLKGIVDKIIEDSENILIK